MINLTDEEKTLIIEEAIRRDRTSSLKIGLCYASVARKLITVDELPQGAIARYGRDIASIQSHVLTPSVVLNTLKDLLGNNAA